MKNRMIPMTLSITVSMISLLTSQMAFGQMWGSGMYGAAPVCAYPQVAATSENADEIADLQNDSRDLAKEKRDNERKLKDFETKKETYSTAISDSLRDAWATKVMDHMENGYNCGCKEPAPSLAPPAEANVVSLNVSAGGNSFDAGWSGGSYSGGDSGGGSSVCGPLDEITLSKPWKSVCRNGGGVAKEVCSNPYFVQSKEKKADCVSAIENYRKVTTGADKLRSQIKSEEDKIKTIAAQIKDLRKDDEEDRSTLEANCPTGTCYKPAVRAQSTTSSLTSTLLPLGLGILGGVGAEYLGYKANQANNTNLNKLGYPTQPYQAGSYGYPFFQAGIYGAVAGSQQQGQFGCSGGIGGGGFMSGPGGMAGMPGMGYGMPGMGMGMMPGMGGMPSMGMPGMGMGMMPGMGGMPSMGMPGMGMGMPSMMNPMAYGNGALGGGMYNPGMGSWGMAGMPGMSGLGGGLGMSASLSPMGLGLGIGTGYGQSPYGMSPYGQSPYGGLGMSGLGGSYGASPYGLGMGSSVGNLGSSYNALLYHMQQLGAGASGLGGASYGLGGVGGLGGLGTSGLGGYGSYGLGTGLAGYGGLSSPYGLGIGSGLGSYGVAGLGSYPYSSSPYLGGTVGLSASFGALGGGAGVLSPYSSGYGR